MKKIMVVLAVMIMSTVAFAQAPFNGTVTFAVDLKGDMVEMLKGMMPNKQVYYYSEGNFRMETSGGVAGGQGDVLYVAKDDKTYILNSSRKKAQEMTSSEGDKTTDGDVVVTETGEKADILGYSCDKYKVVIKTKEGEMVQYIWATKALQPVKPKGAESVTALSGITDKIKGMPLKIQLEINQMGMSFTMITTATKIDNTKPSADLFVVPADYTVEAFDPKKIGR